MPSLKCAQCGLVNFATAVSCKRCGHALSESDGVASYGPDGIVLEDGYVLPPPPTLGAPGSGVWRDKGKLVVSQGAPLPNRCIKCNAPANGPKLKKKLSWHHPALYILVIVGLLIYLIVAMFVRKSITLNLGLCEEHRAKHRRNVLVTWALILLGITGFPLTIITEDINFMLAGIFLIFAGIIFGVVGVRLVSPSMINDKFAWLNGVNKDYLDDLPPWPGP